MLQVHNLFASYGKIEALRGVSVGAETGRITCLLGPNGAGKTTLMYAIAGVQRQTRGSVRLGREELLGHSPAAIVRRGLALVPENRLVFAHMSVKDNLLAGAYLRTDRAEVTHDVQRMFERFPILKERKDQMAGLMSGGEQQMLALARALMSRPKILFLDEPSVGLAPKVVTEIFRIIADLNAEGLTVFLVEQNAALALKFAHFFYLIEQGRITFSGRPDELGNDEVIRRAYLGGSAGTAGSAH